LCIPAGIPGIPSGFLFDPLKKRNAFLFRQECLEKARHTAMSRKLAKILLIT
jgi:hypothetical protein